MNAKLLVRVGGQKAKELRTKRPKTKRQIIKGGENKKNMIGQTKLKTGGNYDPMPSGKYTLQLIEGDMIKDSYKGVETDKFKFKFQILNDVKFTGSDGKEQTTRGRFLWHKFSTYISPKSYLFAFVKIFDPSIVSMTVEQRENYPLDNLAGRQIDALVSKEPNKDGTAVYNNITTFEKCEKELKPVADLEANQGTTTTTQPVNVPAEAPEEETAEGFMQSLEKENVDDEQARLEKKLAELKAKKASK